MLTQIITCAEFAEGVDFEEMYFLVEVEDMFTFKTKSGKNVGQEMARLTLSDKTGQIEGVIFTQKWADYRFFVYPGSTLLVNGTRSTYDNGLIIEKANTV